MGVQIQQRLGRVFAVAIAGIDERKVRGRCSAFHDSAFRMADDDRIDLP